MGPLRHVRVPGGLPHLVDINDIIMSALRGRPRLGEETVGESVFPVGEKFDRDSPTLPRVACKVDRGHATTTQLADQLVLSNESTFV